MTDFSGGNSNPGNQFPEPALSGVGAPVRVGRLAELKSVRAELGRLYRESRKRHGRYPDSTTARRLASVLGEIARSIELETIEARLAALEERARR